MTEGSSNTGLDISARVRLEAATYITANKELSAGKDVVFSATREIRPPSSVKMSSEPYMESLDIVPLSKGVYSVRDRGKTLFAYRSDGDPKKLKNEQDFKYMAAHWKMPGKVKKYLTFLNSRFVFSTLRLPSQTKNTVFVVVSFQGTAFFSFEALNCPKLYKYLYATSVCAPLVHEFVYRTMLLVEKDPPVALVTLIKRDMKDALKIAFPDELEIKDFRSVVKKIRFVVDVASVNSTLLSYTVQVQGYGSFTQPYKETWKEDMQASIKSLKEKPIPDFKIVRHDAKVNKQMGRLKIALASERKPYDTINEERTNTLENKSKLLHKTSDPDAKKVGAAASKASKISYYYLDSGGPVKINADSFHTSGIFNSLSGDDRNSLTKEYGKVINVLRAGVKQNLVSKGVDIPLRMVLSYIPVPDEALSKKLMINANKPLFAIRVGAEAGNWFYYHPYSPETIGYSAQVTEYLQTLSDTVAESKRISDLVIKKFVSVNRRQAGPGKLTSADKKQKGREMTKQRKKRAERSKGKKQSSQYKEARDAKKRNF